MTSWGKERSEPSSPLSPLGLEAFAPEPARPPGFDGGGGHRAPPWGSGPPGGHDAIGPDRYGPGQGPDGRRQVRPWPMQISRERRAGCCPPGPSRFRAEGQYGYCPPKINQIPQADKQPALILPVNQGLEDCRRSPILLNMLLFLPCGGRAKSAASF